MAKVVWPRERIIEVLQEWMADGGDRRIASYHQWLRDHEAPADVTISKVFGGWRHALRAAGFEPVERPGPDPDRVLAAFRSVGARVGRR